MVKMKALPTIRYSPPMKPAPRIIASDAPKGSSRSDSQSKRTGQRIFENALHGCSCNGQPHSCKNGQDHPVQPQLPDDGIQEVCGLKVLRKEPGQYAGVNLERSDMGRAKRHCDSCQSYYSQQRSDQDQEFAFQESSVLLLKIHFRQGYGSMRSLHLKHHILLSRKLPLGLACQARERCCCAIPLHPGSGQKRHPLLRHHTLFRPQDLQWDHTAL